MMFIPLHVVVLNHSWRNKRIFVMRFGDVLLYLQYQQNKNTTTVGVRNLLPFMAAAVWARHFLWMRCSMTIWCFITRDCRHTTVIVRLP